MKVSVSLPEDDIRFLDEYVQAAGMESRSAAVHKAVRLLRAADLGAAYQAAWEEWFASGDAEIWDTAIGDGIGKP